MKVICIRRGVCKRSLNLSDSLPAVLLHLGFTLRIAAIRLAVGHNAGHQAVNVRLFGFVAFELVFLGVCSSPGFFRSGFKERD